MIPAPFDYLRAESVEDAVRLLQARPNAGVLAGGVGLTPALTVRQRRLSALIDIGRVAALRHVERGDDGALRIGALTTLATIKEYADVAQRWPALADAVAAVADAQVRNQATLGGAIAQAHPGSDLPAALLALGATVRLFGAAGRRQILMSDLILGPYQTSLDPTEIIVGVDIPDDGRASAYEKFRNPASGYAICGVAACLAIGSDGAVATCRLAVGGATAKPLRLPAAEGRLVGMRPSVEAAADALRAQVADLPLLSDRAASAEYRAQLVITLGGRAVRRALERFA